MHNHTSAASAVNTQPDADSWHDDGVPFDEDGIPYDTPLPYTRGGVAATKPAITIERESKRKFWILGDTFDCREELKKAGCHWDSEKKAWWCRSAKVAAQFGQVPDSVGEEQEEQDRPSLPMLYVQHRGEDQIGLRLGGPSLDTDGRIDTTVYEWKPRADGALWRIVDTLELEADALKWLAAVRPGSYTDAMARKCAGTLLTSLVGEKAWLPKSDAPNLIPLRDQYLSIEDDGAIRCLAPSPEMGVTWCVNAAFDTAKVQAGCYHPAPVDPDSYFGRYLAMTFDREVEQFAQEALATVLIDRCFEKSIWLYGPGENGKSVMLHILRAVMGRSTAAVNLRRLVRNEFGTNGLIGCRLAVVSEVPRSLSPEMQDTLKALVSQDPITIEKKGADQFTFVPKATWVLAANHAPAVSQHEHGFHRKVLTLPFMKRVPAEKKIQDFHELITKDPREMAQVIDWLLAGAQRLIQRGNFPEAPGAVEKLAEDQRLQTDPVYAFLADRFVTVEPRVRTSKQKVYDAFVDWCAEQGREKWALAAPTFWAQLRAHMPELADDERHTQGKRERFVQLAVQGVDPLPRAEWVSSWKTEEERRQDEIDADIPF